MAIPLPPSNKRFYGWYIVATLAITETISWGIVFYSFSVFITPMEAELGWSRGQISGGFSLALLISALVAFPVGWWVDRHGGRILMTLGSIISTVLLVAWSQITNLTQFYLVWAGMGICFATVLYEPALVIIATWFQYKRGTALAIVTFAAGLASTIFIPLADALRSAYNWRDALLGLAVLLGTTTIPLHALVLRNRPQQVLQPPSTPNQTEDAITETLPSASLRETLHSPFFWLLTFAFSLIYIAASAIRVHFIPFLLDNGIEASRAAVASGAIGFMQVMGRVVFAPLDNRISSRVMVIGVFVLQTIGLMVLLINVSIGAVFLFITFFGMAFGATTLARPSILLENFGTNSFGRISSVTAIFLTLARTIGPVGAGWFYDHFANYTTTLWVIVGLSLLASLVMLAAKPPHQSSISGPSLP